MIMLELQLAKGIRSSADNGLDEHLKCPDELVMSLDAHASDRMEVTCVGNLHATIVGQNALATMFSGLQVFRIFDCRSSRWLCSIWTHGIGL